MCTLAKATRNAATRGPPESRGGQPKDRTSGARQTDLPRNRSPPTWRPDDRRPTDGHDGSGLRRPTGSRIERVRARLTQLHLPLSDHTPSRAAPQLPASHEIRVHTDVDYGNDVRPACRTSAARSNAQRRSASQRAGRRTFGALFPELGGHFFQLGRHFFELRPTSSSASEVPDLRASRAQRASHDTQHRAYSPEGRSLLAQKGFGQIATPRHNAFRACRSYWAGFGQSVGGRGIGCVARLGGGSWRVLGWL